MNSCVIKNEDFYSLAEEHGIDGSELELIVHKYWNEVGKEDSFPPSSYINEQLGIGKSYDEASENVRKLWERDYSRPIKLKSEFELNGAVQKAKTFFPADAITTYKDNKGNFVLRVAEPFTSSSIDKEIQDIFAKAPRDSQGRLLAPNGKVSNLTEKQYAQVRTKAFKKWFGDWTKITFDDNGTPIIPNDVSKVVDENGEPLVVYHGNTDTNITKFTKGKGRYLKDGNYYFSPSKSVAESYATNGLSEDIDINDYLVIGYNVDANSEEAKYADLILHVVDMANPQMDEQMFIVYETLKNLEVIDKPVITIFNKMDKAGNQQIIRDFHADYTVKISAKMKDGISELLQTIEAVLREQKVAIENLYSYQEAGKIQLIRKYGELQQEDYRDDGIFVRAFVPVEIYDKVRTSK